MQATTILSLIERFPALTARDFEDVHVIMQDRGSRIPLSRVQDPPKTDQYTFQDGLYEVGPLSRDGARLEFMVRVWMRTPAVDSRIVAIHIPED